MGVGQEAPVPEALSWEGYRRTCSFVDPRRHLNGFCKDMVYSGVQHSSSGQVCDGAFGGLFCLPLGLTFLLSRCVSSPYCSHEAMCAASPETQSSSFSCVAHYSPLGRREKGRPVHAFSCNLQRTRRPGLSRCTRITDRAVSPTWELILEHQSLGPWIQTLREIEARRCCLWLWPQCAASAYQAPLCGF